MGPRKTPSSLRALSSKSRPGTDRTSGPQPQPEGQGQGRGAGQRLSWNSTQGSELWVCSLFASASCFQACILGTGDSEVSKNDGVPLM